MNQWLRTGAVGLLALPLVASVPAAAQSVTPVPKLDLNQFTAPWYEQARIASKREKPCVSDNVVLYSLGDKKNSFQLVISCLIKNTNWESWNQNGKLDPAGSGALRLRRIWPFTSPYNVIAAAPDMQWMVVGTPNHKSLWLLSRTQIASPELLSGMRSRAAAQGFDVSKLINVPQHQSVTSATSGASQPTDAQPRPSNLPH